MKIYGLIIVLLFLLLNCKSKHEVLYHIYAEGDTSDNEFKLADVAEIEDVTGLVMDTSYFDTEEISAYLDEDESFITNINIEEKDWSNDSVLATGFVVDSLVEVDTIVQSTSVDESTVAKLSEEDSLEVFTAIDSNVSAIAKNDSIGGLESSIIEVDSLTTNDVVSDVMETTNVEIKTTEIENLNAAFNNTNDVKKEVKKQMYLIDKNIYKSRLAYIEVDTIQPVLPIDSGKTIIVVRKLRNQLDEVKPLVSSHEVETPAVVAKVEETPVLRKEKTYRLKYDLGSSAYNDDEELNLAYEEMKTHPELVAVISSRTDASGSESVNMKLSAKRSEVVRAYLMKKGISEKRIFTQYLGEKYASTPVNENERETLIILK